MLTVDNSLKSLWVIVVLNLVGGFFAWMSGVLETHDTVTGDLWWEATGLSMMGFGILVLVVTLATSAIVASNRERSSSTSA